MRATLLVGILTLITPVCYATQSIWPGIRQEFRLDHHTQNAKVRYYLNYYRAHRQKFETIMERARLYLPTIFELTRAEDLPSEIALLPFIESGFNPNAKSSASALGLWQLMGPTAKRFNLDIHNTWLDPRRDVTLSTGAALNYMVTLYQLFSRNWTLALAAYNSGEGTVMDALIQRRKRGLSSDFWSLSLPSETSDYFPKLMAIAAIVNNPSRYGLSLPHIPLHPSSAKFLLVQQITLNQAAQFAGIPLSDIKTLNPGFVRMATPPGGIHFITLPKRQIARFRQHYESYLKTQKRQLWKSYTVKSGDTLSHIAKETGTSISTLKHSNHLSSSRLYPGQYLLYPLDLSKIPHVHYTVKYGDNLTRIAQHFGVKVSDITRKNGIMRNSVLKVGQQLIIK